jgi:Fe-S cluster assembly protein SufD
MSAVLRTESLRDAVAVLPENRLAGARRRALEHLLENGLPDTRDEDWKYTDLGRVVELSNAWLARRAASAAGIEAQASGAELTRAVDAIWLVVANGVVCEASLAAARGAGVDVRLLSESKPDIDYAAPLSALNAALLVDGLHIRIDGDSMPTKPLGIMVTDSAATSIGVTQARVEIEVGTGCTADIVEYQHSHGTAGHYANSVINMSLAADATVNYVRLQARALAHSQTGRLSVRLERDATFRQAAFDLGGALVRNDLSIDVVGAGAEARFAGLYLAAGTQHVDNHTRVDHRVGPARSAQHYRGIAAGKGRCVWNGKAIVHAGADLTDAEQADHNLLLSAGAEIDAKPELEIYADDVKCSHGTTVGQLDRNALYYLRTRGLDRRDAERLLTLAFARAIVDLTPIPAVEEWLAGLVTARVGTLIEEADA